MPKARATEVLPFSGIPWQDGRVGNLFAVYQTWIRIRQLSALGARARPERPAGHRRGVVLARKVRPERSEKSPKRGGLKMGSFGGEGYSRAACKKALLERFCGPPSP